ncbi:hypothetical protein KCU78_g5898, partial [Aureobasidium melanogenum]
MSNQTCHFIRLPVELRLIIYEYVFADLDEQVLHHGIASVSEQVAEEVMPILLQRISGFYWTAIPCNEEWYLAIRPCNKIWRMHLTNAPEKPLSAVPEPRTEITYHLLIGRYMVITQDLSRRLRPNGLTGKLSHTCSFYLESEDQKDGVKRLVRTEIDGRHGGVEALSPLWIERGKIGAPEMNKKLTERVWHEQWHGGGRRGPGYALMCVFQKQSGQQG